MTIPEAHPERPVGDNPERRGSTPGRTRRRAPRRTMNAPPRTFASCRPPIAFGTIGGRDQRPHGLDHGQPDVQVGVAEHLAGVVHRHRLQGEHPCRKTRALHKDDERSVPPQHVDGPAQIGTARRLRRTVSRESGNTTGTAPPPPRRTRSSIVVNDDSRSSAPSVPGETTTTIARIVTLAAIDLDVASLAHSSGSSSSPPRAIRRGSSRSCRRAGTGRR